MTYAQYVLKDRIETAFVVLGFILIGAMIGVAL